MCALVIEARVPGLVRQSLQTQMTAEAPHAFDHGGNGFSWFD